MVDMDLRRKLIILANENIPSEDVSHDFTHAMRVLKNAENISKIEGGDLEVIIASSLFHDVIKYPITLSIGEFSLRDSSRRTAKLLQDCGFYPNKKIPLVQVCIEECSFSKNIQGSSLESKILQDADLLESTGAVSIMRTFASAGQMKNAFYNMQDPFCTERIPEEKHYALDLFFTRLLKVKDRLNTKTALLYLDERERFLKSFLNQLKKEI